MAWPPSESAVGVEPRGAAAGAEPWEAVAAAPDGPRAKAVAVVAAPRGAVAEVVVAPWAGEALQAVVSAPAPPSEVRSRAEMCRSIRKTCFPKEMTCGTSGT